jgi:hypothetical protein
VARPASPTKVIEADGHRFVYDRATQYRRGTKVWSVIGGRT